MVEQEFKKFLSPVNLKITENLCTATLERKVQK